MCAFVWIRQQTVYLIHRLHPSHLIFFMLNKCTLVHSYNSCTFVSNGTLAGLEMLHLIIRTLKLPRWRFTCKRMPQPTEPSSQGIANLSFIYTHSSSVFRLTNPLCRARRALEEEFPPHFSLCPTWKCGSVAAFSPVQPSCCGLRHEPSSYLWAHFTAAPRAVADSSGGKDHPFAVLSVMRRHLRESFCFQISRRRWPWPG